MMTIYPSYKHYIQKDKSTPASFEHSNNRWVSFPVISSESNWARKKFLSTTEHLKICSIHVNQSSQCVTEAQRNVSNSWNRRGEELRHKIALACCSWYSSPWVYQIYFHSEEDWPIFAWGSFIWRSWSGSHMRWGQPFRLRHLSTGHYLGQTEDRGLVLLDREKSDTAATSFCFRPSKVWFVWYKTCIAVEGRF